MVDKFLTDKLSKFKSAVTKIVSLVPKGKVVSYGQVALYLGLPRAARQVGWILNGLEGKTPVPWWRVVNNTGRISIKASRYSANEQRALLVAEGIDVNDDLTLDIEKYRFRPNKKFIERIEFGSNYLEMISRNIPYTKT